MEQNRLAGLTMDGRAFQACTAGGHPDHSAELQQTPGGSSASQSCLANWN